MSKVIYTNENEHETAKVKIKYVGRYDSFHIDMDVGKLADEKTLTKEEGEPYYFGHEHVGMVRNALFSKILSLFSNKDSREIAKERAIRKADRALKKKTRQQEREWKLEQKMEGE